MWRGRSDVVLKNWQGAAWTGNVRLLTPATLCDDDSNRQSDHHSVLATLFARLASERGRIRSDRRTAGCPWSSGANAGGFGRVQGPRRTGKAAGPVAVRLCDHSQGGQRVNRNVRFSG